MHPHPARVCFNRVIARTAGAVFFAFALIAPVLVQAEVLTITGSGNPEVVLKALAAAFSSRQTEHSVVVPPSVGSAGALRDVLAGTTVLSRMGRALRPDELAKGLTYIPLGRDPVAFAAGSDIKLSGLTQAQILDTFAGRVTNWRELGAKPAPIRVIGREQADASRQAINRAIKPFESMVYPESAKIVNLDPQMLDLLDRFPSSIGFLNRSALSAAKTKLNLLAIDGVAPSQANVGSGQYGMWVELGLIHRSGKLSPGATAFIDFIRSSEGLRVLRASGVLAAAATP